MQSVDVLKKFHSDLAALGGTAALEGVISTTLNEHLRHASGAPQRLGPVPDVLESFLSQLTSSLDSDPLTRDGVLNVELQRQLSEVGMHQFIVEDLLPALFAVVPPAELTGQRYGEPSLRTVRLLFRLLWALAKKNARNGHWLFGRLSFLMSHIASGFNAAHVIQEVFSDDRDLMCSCEDGFIRQMWQLAIDQSAERYLTFCSSLLSFNGRPIKFNQDRISEIVRQNATRTVWLIPASAEEHTGFHIELVRLAALLCARRHRESIDFFLTRVGLGYLTVLERMSRGPATVRLVYAQLMFSLFVDREPYEMMLPCQTTRIMPSIRGLPSAAVEQRLGVPPPSFVDPYDGLLGYTRGSASRYAIERPTPGFADLKAVIFSEIEAQQAMRATQIAQNQYIAELIRLAHRLLRYGIFDHNFDTGQHNDGVITLGPEAVRLAGKLLLLLDGRSDDVSGLQTSVEGVAPRFRADLQETRTIMTIKTLALDTIDDILALRASSKIDLLVRHVVATGTGSSASVHTAPSGESEFLHNPLSTTFETETKVDTSHSTVAPATDLAADMQAAAADAMSNADKIRVFLDGDAVKLTESLLDLICYSENSELSLRAFNTLFTFNSRHTMFSNVLHRVNVLCTDEAAGNFIRAMNQMREFRRLHKWLHLKKECEQCVQVCETLGTWCQNGTDGQKLLRHLNLEDYTIRVLRMRITAPHFPHLIRACLELVDLFCRHNRDHQNLMAKHMDDVFVRLLRDPLYSEATASCIAALVHDNQRLSVAYSGVLTQTVADLALTPAHGRRLVLLKLLLRLLVVDGRPVQKSQTIVCRISRSSRMLIETVGDVGVDEWGSGPAIDRLQLLRMSVSRGSMRSTTALQYYAQSLIVLGTCARGKMPTTELLCAALIPFDECVARLGELYTDPDLVPDDEWHLRDRHESIETVAQVKSALMTFFREVFVDTNSETILMALRMPHNGIWTRKSRESSTGWVAQPLIDYLVNDMQQLLEFEQNWHNDPSTPRRCYLFEELIMFFIQYGRVVGPSAAALTENDIISGAYARVKALVDAAGAHRHWQPRESLLLQQCSAVASSWVVGVDPPHPTDEQVYQLLSASAARQKAAPLPDINFERWQSFIRQAVSSIPVDTIKGTDRRVGIGIIEIAQQLWRMADDIEAPLLEPEAPSSTRGDQALSGSCTERQQQPDRFVNFLIRPLYAQMALLKQDATLAAIPAMLTVLDTVRAVPFCATIYTDAQKSEAFRRFVAVKPVDSQSNPDVAEVQTSMVRHGWALVCFDVLASVELAPLHLTSLRLLLALTTGSNKYVQDALLEQLVSGKAEHGLRVPNEVFATSCRHLLKASIRDARAHRKGSQSRGAANSETDLALETLTVMSNVCDNNHTGMQDYFLTQMGHGGTLDLVTDVVAFLSSLENDLKALAVDPPSVLQEGSALRKASAAFQLLRNMASGPHLANQRVIVNSELIPICNRILAYTEYDKLEDVDQARDDPAPDRLQTPKGVLNSAIALLLLALVEGVPDRTVVLRLLSGLDWNYISAHLENMRGMLEQGLLRSTIAEESASGAGTGTSPLQLPHSIRDAEWLHKLSFQLFSFTEKIRHAGHAFNAVVKDDVMIPFEPIENNIRTQRFFNSRTGECQVIRNDALEYLFFPMPRSSEFIRDGIITKVMQRVPTDDSASKLRTFLAGAHEIAEEVISYDAVASMYGRRLPAFFSWCQRHHPTMYLSFVICSLTALSFEKKSSGWSLDVQTFGRQPDLYYVFLAFSLLHLAISVLRAFVWSQLRYPVLRGLYQRTERLRYLREGQHAHEVPPNLKSEVVSRSVIVKGLPHAVGGSRRKRELTSQIVASLFSRFGIVATSAAVSVAPDDIGEKDDQSWAMVTFARAAVAAKVSARSRRAGGLRLRCGVVFVFELTMKRVAEIPALSTMVDAALEHAMIEDHDPVQEQLSRLQRLLNRTPLGRVVSLHTLWTFRQDRELIGSGLDIAASLLGGLYSPLFYTYHLFKLAEFEGAVIVIASMSQNIGRLATTLLLCLLFTWVFAISGLLFFEEVHTDYQCDLEGSNASKACMTVANDGGPCANLLTCFFSYSYVALLQGGLSTWITANVFPLGGHEMASMEFAKSMWETIFAMLAMFVVAIITGIICDTFGELRADQDAAKEFIDTVCFVTGIPFKDVPPEKSTNPLQYVYLLLHLRQRRESRITPLERYVRDKCADGDVSWMPDGRCVQLDNRSNDLDDGADGSIGADGAIIQRQLDEIKQRLLQTEKLLRDAGLGPKLAARTA